jgi:hypothetical protein
MILVKANKQKSPPELILGGFFALKNKDNYYLPAVTS